MCHYKLLFWISVYFISCIWRHFTRINRLFTNLLSGIYFSHQLSLVSYLWSNKRDSNLDTQAGWLSIARPIRLRDNPLSKLRTSCNASVPAASLPIHSVALARWFVNSSDTWRASPECSRLSMGRAASKMKVFTFYTGYQNKANKDVSPLSPLLNRNDIIFVFNMVRKCILSQKLCFVSITALEIFNIILHFKRVFPLTISNCTIMEGLSLKYILIKIYIYI